MLVRLFSDVHNEFGYFVPPVIEGEKDMVLVLAGDIGTANKPRTIGPFVNAMARRHRTVIYIAGNHEHYDSSLVRSHEKMKAAVGMWQELDMSKPNALGIPSNVFIIENEVVIIDDVAFIGATLWTDFNRNDPAAMLAAKMGLNDYRWIRTGSQMEAYKRKIKPLDLLFEHNRSKAFIFDQIAAHKQAGRKTFVISHHAPCGLSIADRFREPHFRPMNGSYASELGNEIADAEPNVWVHGHTHDSFDYMVNNTRVVCNPRGYVGEFNPGFNPALVIEI